MEELRNEHTAQAQSRIDNLMELMSVGQEFAKTEENNLENFLGHVALVSDIDDAELGEDAIITLMTFILRRVWNSRSSFWPVWRKVFSRMRGH